MVKEKTSISTKPSNDLSVSTRLEDKYECGYRSFTAREAVLSKEYE